VSFLICVVLSLLRFLILLVHFCVGNQVTRIRWGPEANKQPKLLQERSSEINSPGTAEEKPARELINAWFSAYSALNPKRMAALETAGVEVVDGFGDSHYFLSRNDREQFWADGFEMIETQGFHPRCVLQHIRLLHPDVAIVQATVAYPHGIRLKGGERIPPYSEVHTFVVAKNEETWLIAAHNFTRQVLPTTPTGTMWQKSAIRAPRAAPMVLAR
jgi:uncharacterized protein (TIGR02246 family)